MTITTDFTVTDSVVRGRDGDIPVRDYLPALSPSLTPLLWVHGGGFVLGGLDQVESDAPARYLAARGRRVRTIDYRLAPNIGLFKNPRLGTAPGRFPEAHHDVLDVAESLRALGGPVCIGGASAGANLAAGAVLALRDMGGWMPQSMVLAYGALHWLLPRNTGVESGLRGLAPRWFFNDAPDQPQLRGLGERSCRAVRVSRGSGACGVPTHPQHRRDQ
jgi:acetyl esterase